MADPGEGPGSQAPALIFRPKWGPKGRKIFVLRPPGSPYLRVWITAANSPPLPHSLIWRSRSATGVCMSFHMRSATRRGTPLYKLGMRRPIGSGYFAGLVWKRVYTLSILVWNRYGFWGNFGSVWTYLSFQFQMSKKEREICKFQMDLMNSFVYALI